MGKQIVVGDLVVIVKPSLCCGSVKSIGHIHKVIGIPPQPLTRCETCGFIQKSINEVLLEGSWAIEISRLIRIDPPAIADETRQDKRITA